MVAVFTKYPKDFQRGRMSGDNDIKIIRNVDSIRGIRFTSVMELNNWYDNQDLDQAYKALEIRQPELFKKFRAIV